MISISPGGAHALETFFLFAFRLNLEDAPPRHIANISDESDGSVFALLATVCVFDYCIARLRELRRLGKPSKRVR